MRIAIDARMPRRGFHGRRWGLGHDSRACRYFEQLCIGRCVCAGLKKRGTRAPGCSSGRPARSGGAAVLLTMDGVPHFLTRDEFAELAWRNWISLFVDYQLDWHAFGHATFEHFQDADRSAALSSRSGLQAEDFIADICLLRWRTEKKLPVGTGSKRQLHTVIRATNNCGC
jgi:hypothetical protein